MAKISDLFENAGAPGVIVGIGAVLLAPVIVPVVAGVGKPVAKSLIKGGLVAYERSKGVIAELGETWEDIIAEARAELAEDQQLPVFEPAGRSEEMKTDNGV